MSGIQYVGRTGNFQDPRKEEKLLSNSIAAASATNPALFWGDFVVLTTVAALTGTAPNNGPVLRRLSVADRTANYLQTAAAGIYGVIFDNIITNSSGQITGSPWSGSPPGNAILNMPNEAGSASFDPVTGRSRANVFVVDPTMLFMARINVNTTDFASGLVLGHQYDGTRCGICFTANTGVNSNQAVFTLRPAAAAADQILIIHRPNEQDPNYGKTVLGTDTFANNAIADARSGPTVIFSVREEYCQVLNGVMYTTNSGGTI